MFLLGLASSTLRPQTRQAIRKTSQGLKIQGSEVGKVSYVNGCGRRWSCYQHASEYVTSTLYFPAESLDLSS